MEYLIHIKGIEAAPQGSKKFVGRNIKGQPMMIDTCKRLKSWRDQVGIMAKLVCVDGIIEEPVSIEVTFYFKRPKLHYDSKNILKQDAPTYVTNRLKGDIDKLLRGLLDGLTGSAFADDSQVVKVFAVKKYCDLKSKIGATIKIKTINEEENLICGLSRM